VRRLPALGFAIIAGITMCACGGATWSAHGGATAPVSTPTSSTPTEVDVVWTPVLAAQTQAADLEAAEQRYATCFSYAALDQDLSGTTSSASTPPVQSCSTSGLTSTEVQIIQDLIRADS